MKNTFVINREIIRRIATALQELNERVIFVGGAVVSLYIDDPAADEIRPTKDIDITMEIASLSELEELRIELVKKGFVQTADDDVVCRFRYDDIIVDVMGTKEIGWAPGDRWFELGFSHKVPVEIDGVWINILPLPYFLASKFSAFHDRGGSDPRTSHDFEDITYILDNQTRLIDKISEAPAEVREFLVEESSRILASDTLQEAILGNLFHETQTDRFELIVSKLRGIVK